MAEARRTIKTVTGAGGQGRDIYDQAIDPSRSTIDSARLIAERAEKAQIDFLFTADLLRFGSQGAIGSQEPLMFVAAQDTGHWSVAGTPEQSADTIEERFNAGVLDVISLGGIADDEQHDFAVNGLLADLRNRGIVNEGYQGTTLRENLGLPAETLPRASV